MANPNSTPLKIKRFGLWAAREALRIQTSWELHAVLLTFLFAMTFGFVAGLFTFILTHELTLTTGAGFLAFFLNGFALGRACFSAKDPWEIQGKMLILDREIAKALELQKIFEKEEHFRKEMLRREREELRLAEEQRLQTLALERKALEEEQQRQAQEIAQQLVQKNEIRYSVTAAARHRSHRHGTACWYCRQPLLSGWIQCVFCKMLS
jgi:hypothetical protein